MYNDSMYSKELIKGTLTTIILKLLSHNEKMYGYEITQRVKIITDGKIVFKEGSLYPALHKLKDDGLIKTEKEVVNNRVRKYYSLTEKGRRSTTEKVDELESFISAIRNVLVYKPETT